jgi:hypothetical protein
VADLLRGPLGEQRRRVLADAGLDPGTATAEEVEALYLPPDARVRRLTPPPTAPPGTPTASTASPGWPEAASLRRPPKRPRYRWTIEPPPAEPPGEAPREPSPGEPPPGEPPASGSRVG